MLSPKERPDPHKSLVGFVVGSVNYAVPISAVREIVNAVTLTELPHLPAALAGVADHRGDVIPIINLRARFGVSGEPPRRSKWILVEVAGRLVGLMVDGVTEVFGTAGQRLRPAPSLGDNTVGRGIAGVAGHEGQLVFVLALERFEDLLEHLHLPDKLLEGGAS